MQQSNWFFLEHEQQIDSPALLIYKNRVQYNIDLMLKIAGNPDKLIPHVKTHKMAEIVRMQLQAGIKKFKCATIAEAEMVATEGASFVLLAYQLVSPKTERFINLIKKFPETTFASLIDNVETGKKLNNIFEKENLKASIFIDVNNGMNRSGHEVNEELLVLYFALQKLSNITVLGLHIYDGHITNANFEERKKLCNEAFEEVNNLIIKELKNKNIEPIVIAGGSPTFPIHALQPTIFCSPGTCLLWDFGYGDKFLDQPFQYAALLLTRVISKPKKGIITIDLGHKSVAAENSIDKRFRLLNLENYKVISQSEEHGVIEVANWEDISVGKVLYALPHHVCPTVNLYEEANIILEGKLVDKWQIIARKRKINY